MPLAAASPRPAVSAHPMQRPASGAACPPEVATHPDNACTPHARHRPPTSPVQLSDIQNPASCYVLPIVAGTSGNVAIGTHLRVHRLAIAAAHQCLGEGV